MKRPHWHPPTCKLCGKPNRDGSRVSQKGMCEPCGLAALHANVDQMEARSGPNFTKWRHGMIRCAGGAVLDDLRDTA